MDRLEDLIQKHRIRRRTASDPLSAVITHIYAAESAPHRAQLELTQAQNLLWKVKGSIQNDLRMLIEDKLDELTKE